MAKLNQIRLGVIGLSEGNGHPYSWSAICNGYDPLAMESCPFPVIPAYLKEQSWPEAKIDNVIVSHIWTQNQDLSKDIAAAALIKNIVNKPEKMIGKVDGILLARDDAENHYSLALPFLDAGLPVFIDKPFALNLEDAKQMLRSQRFESQIFTCSSLRYAEELRLREEDWSKTGLIYHVEAQVPKSWEKYGVHIVEPVVANLPNRGELLEINKEHFRGIKKVKVVWEKMSAIFSSYDQYSIPIKIHYYGESNFCVKQFSNTFSCFKKSLEDFIRSIKLKNIIISRAETLEIVQIIEKGS